MTPARHHRQQFLIRFQILFLIRPRDWLLASAQSDQGSPETGSIP
jgi:hypothetical protein